MSIDAVVVVVVVVLRTWFGLDITVVGIDWFFILADRGGAVPVLPGPRHGALRVRGPLRAHLAHHLAHLRLQFTGATCLAKSAQSCSMQIASIKWKSNQAMGGCQ